MADPTTDIFSEEVRKDLIETWERASKANNSTATDVAEAALGAVDDAEAAVTKAAAAISSVKAL